MAEIKADIVQSMELSGTLKLSAMAVPALEEGSYTVTAQQDWDIGKLGTTVRRFTVEAESVAMAPDQIYSVYPPKNSSGCFENTLPHVILNRRTLPWERKPSPWLALLVFSQNEAVRLADGKYRNLCQEDGVYVPEPGGSPPDGETECRAIDIPSELFAEILPAQEDIPYLAHVRDVSLDCKVTDREVTNGGFACVLSNRYPKASEYTGQSVEHVAALVSLDGFQHFLDKDADERKALLEGKDFVRMFVFTVWSFFCESADYNFAEAANTLDIDLPRIKQNEINKVDGPLRQILQKGYYPMNHCFRDKSVGVSLYRPPLLPCKPIVENNEFGRYSDSLLRFDPELGIYDASYSAAWQLGRLLSMQDQALAKNILSWRNNGKQNSAKNQNAAALTSTLKPFTGARRRGGGRRRKRSESLDGSEWRGIVPDLKNTVGITQAVDIEGSELPAKAEEKLLSDDVGELLRTVKERAEKTPGQLALLEAFDLV